MGIKKILIFAGIIALLNIFDGVATNYGLLHQHIEESNPLMNQLWHFDPLFFIVLKLALSLLIIGMSVLIYQKSTRAFQRIFLMLQGVSLVIYVYIFSLHLYWLPLV